MLLTDMKPRSYLLSFSISILVLIISSSCKNASAQGTLPAALGSSCINPVMDKAYAAKVNSVLSTLSGSSFDGLDFRNITIDFGNGQDVVYGLYLCRGDVSWNDCQNCVEASATEEILKQCPNDKTAIIWYDNCFLRYSNQSDFPDTRLFMLNTQNSTDPQRFSQYVGNMLNILATQTSASGKKFAVKEGNFTASEKVYSLAQCIPIISSTDCNTCLRAAINEFPSFCDGCLGARVLSPVCNIRFETYRFYNVVTPPGTP